MRPLTETEMQTVTMDSQNVSITIVQTGDAVFWVDGSLPYAEEYIQKLHALGYRDGLHFVNQCALSEIPCGVIKEPRGCRIVRNEDNMFEIQETK